MFEWFDLKSVEALLVAGAALVAIISATFAAYSKLFPSRPKLNKKHTSNSIDGQINQSGTGNVVGTGNTVVNQKIDIQKIVHINYSKDEYESDLKRSEAERRQEFKSFENASEKPRAGLEKELSAIREKFVDLEQNYQKRVSELERIATEVKDLANNVSAQTISEAIAALEQGDLQAADAIFAEVESTARPKIEIAAKAAYERGCIAYAEIRWLDAREHFERADRLLPRHREYAKKAAFLAFELGEYETAQRRYEAILEDVRAEEGEYSLGTSDALNDLGATFRRQGRYPEAVENLKQALEIAEKLLAPNDPILARRYGNLGLAFCDQGDFKEARELQKKAVSIVEKSLPLGHLDIAVSYNNLALVYSHQELFEDAIEFYKKAIDIGKAALPLEHPTLAKYYCNLAMAYEGLDCLEKAAKFCKRSIEISENSLPAGHPLLAIRYNSLGVIRTKQNRGEKAIELYERAIKIELAAFSENHPSLANRYTNIANAYIQQGRFPDAEEALKKSIEIDKKFLPAEHPYRDKGIEKLAYVYERLGRPDDARKIRKKLPGNSKRI